MSNETSDSVNAVEEIVRLSRAAAAAYGELEKNLDVAADTCLKKFILEQIEAVENDGQTRHVRVLDEVRLTDLIIEKAVGEKFAHVECEYQHVNWDKFQGAGEILYLYEDERPKFKEMRAEAFKRGVREIRSICTPFKCWELVNFMQTEEKVGNAAKAVFFPHEYTAEQAVKLIELYGISVARLLAKIGGAVAAPPNFIEAMTSEKSNGQALIGVDIVNREIFCEHLKSAKFNSQGAIGQAVIGEAMAKRKYVGWVPWVPQVKLSTLIFGLLKLMYYDGVDFLKEFFKKR